MLPTLPSKTRKSLLFSEELEKFSYNSLKDLVDIGKFWNFFLFRRATAPDIPRNNRVT